MSEKKVAAMQQKYQELQMIDQQMKLMQQQAQMLDKQVMELQGVEQSLDDFKQAKEGDEALVPLSPGVYAKGKLEATDTLIVNVGASTAVVKSVEDVRKLIHRQYEEMQKMQNEVTENINKLAQEGVNLQEEIQKLV